MCECKEWSVILNELNKLKCLPNSGYRKYLDPKGKIGLNNKTRNFVVYISYGDTLPHTVVRVCGEFQRTGRFLQRGI